MMNTISKFKVMKNTRLDYEFKNTSEQITQYQHQKFNFMRSKNVRNGLKFYDCILSSVP